MIDPIPKAPAASRIAVPLQGDRDGLDSLSSRLDVGQGLSGRIDFCVGRRTQQ